MSTLTYMYVTDRDGNLNDPATGKKWTADSEFFNIKLLGSAVICDEDYLRRNWRVLMPCKQCIMLGDMNAEERLLAVMQTENFPADFIPIAVKTAEGAIGSAKYALGKEEILAVGGHDALLRLENYVNRILMTGVGERNPLKEGEPQNFADDYWIPMQLKRQIKASGNVGAPWSMPRAPDILPNKLIHSVRYEWRYTYTHQL